MKEKVGSVLWVVAQVVFVAWCLALNWSLAMAAIILMVVALVVKWPARGRRRDEEIPERGWDYWTSPDPRKGEFWPAGYWTALLAFWGGLAVLLFIRMGTTDESQPVAFPIMWAVFAGYGLYRNRTEGYRPPVEGTDGGAAAQG